MTITVLDTFTGIDTVLRAPAAERSARLTAMLTPMAGMYRYFPGEVDLEAMHRMSFGFPIDRDNDACSDALATLHEADAWGRISRALDDALTVQLAATPGIEIPDITVLIVLGDPGDAYFMESAKGMSGNGSAFGYISLTFWPTPENLARLEEAIQTRHEIVHTGRKPDRLNANWIKTYGNNIQQVVNKTDSVLFEYGNSFGTMIDFTRANISQAQQWLVEEVGDADEYP